MLTINAEAQQAAYDGLARQARRGRRARPAHRRDPRDGHHARRTTRTGCPATTPATIREELQQARAATREPMLEPGDRADLSAGLDVQARHRGRGARAAASTRRTPRCSTARQLDLPQTTRDAAELRRRAVQPQRPDRPLDATRCAISCNTAFGELGLELGDDALRAQAEKFGFDQPLRDARCAPSRAAFPASPNPPQPRSRRSASSTCAATPLQMAMVAGGDRQRRRRDEARTS